MKLGEFLKDKVVEICILVFVLITIEIFLLAFRTSLFIHIYVVVSISLAYVIVLLIEYYKKKTFYNTIQKNLDQLDKKYLLPEMIKKTNFCEAKLLKQILIETEKSMAEHVNEYKFSQEEYKEYIELWIHEIKTPISVSKMIIENNKNEITKNIEEELDKIDGFIEQALFYARSNHLEKDYIIKQTDLKDIINNVIQKNKKQLISNKIKINIHDTDNKVFTDSKWIIFILNQIIVNSIKYKSKEPEIEIYSKKDKENIKLYIKDNGIGIKENEIKKVFDKGFTGTNGRNTNKSTGIGLYLCKKLCNKLGHDIGVTSQENEGTTLVITFPQNSYIQI